MEEERQRNVKSKLFCKIHDGDNSVKGKRRRVIGACCAEHRTRLRASQEMIASLTNSQTLVRHSPSLYLTLST